MPSSRPYNQTPPPEPMPLLRWPPAPSGFTEEEKVEWRKYGRALLPLGTVSASDLLLVEMAAQESARLAAMRRDPLVKPSSVTATSRHLAVMLQSLGLSPSSRRTVAPLPMPRGEAESDPMAEFDQPTEQ